MATFTEHYDLIKPGTDDYYDVADFNENMDAIDTQLYQAEQDMAGVSEKIGNPGDEGEDTLFGLLNPGGKGGLLPLFQNGNQKTDPELEAQPFRLYHILWKTYHFSRRKERYSLCKMDLFRHSKRRILHLSQSASFHPGSAG